MPSRRRKQEGLPRKKPTSPQGRAIFSAIVEAARLIAEEEGHAALTSNYIAQKAGVSIGSFYQYFPNTEAVLGELARGVELRLLERISHSFDTTEDPLSMIDAAVDVLVSRVLGGFRTRSLLLQQVPRGWIREVSSEVDAELVRLLEKRLVHFGDRLADLGDPAISAFVLVTSLEAVVEKCIDRHPEWVESGELCDYLRKLVVRFLGLPERSEPIEGAHRPNSMVQGAH